MRRRLIVTGVVAVVAAAAIVASTAGRGSSGDSDGPASSFVSRTADAGEVTVKATLQRLDAGGAVADMVFDTHAVELDLDVPAGAVLTVGGLTWPTQGWEGDGPGGHHREGELRFAPGGPVAGEATLTISGLDDPVTFRWPTEPR